MASLALLFRQRAEPYMYTQNPKPKTLCSMESADELWEQACIAVLT